MTKERLMRHRERARTASTGSRAVLCNVKQVELGQKLSDDDRKIFYNINIVMAGGYLLY
jgi:hypothetical protein